MTSFQEMFERGRQSATRQTRQIQSGRVVHIDRSSLPWTVDVEFVDANHPNGYVVPGIPMDPLINLADSGAIFVLPRNFGDGAEEDTEAPSVAVEAAQGDSDEANSIVQWHGHYSQQAMVVGELQFPGVLVNFARTGADDGWEVLPARFPWTNDDGGTLPASVQPPPGSLNLSGQEVNLYAGKTTDVKETALRVWLEPTADGYGRVNILYGVDHNAVGVAARRVADIPLVHPSAVDDTSGKIRTEPADPEATAGANPAASGNAGGNSHSHAIPHTHPMADHFHEIPILAVRPIRIWYAT